MGITMGAVHVDKLKELPRGKQCEVTDREFVVRRAFRFNDLLPDDPRGPPTWHAGPES